MGQILPQKTLGDTPEMFRLVRNKERVMRRTAAQAPQPFRLEQLLHLARRLGGGIDERDPPPHHLLQDRLQQRIMGATQDERINVLGLERRQVFFRHILGVAHSERLQTSTGQ